MVLVTGETVDCLNRLLRGEAAAADAYSHAALAFEGRPECRHLGRIGRSHEASADALRDHLATLGADPTDDYGFREMFDSLVTNVAEFFGTRPSLLALRRVERHLLDEYQEALTHADLPIESAAVVRAALLLHVQDNLRTLAQLAAEA